DCILNTVIEGCPSAIGVRALDHSKSAVHETTVDRLTGYRVRLNATVVISARCFLVVVLEPQDLGAGAEAPIQNALLPSHVLCFHGEVKRFRAGRTISRRCQDLNIQAVKTMELTCHGRRTTHGSEH